MHKDLLSFFALLMLASTVVLGVLLINTKRQLLTAKSSPATVVPTETKKEAKLPIPRTYVNPIVLPEPKLKGTMSVEEAIFTRRSQRAFLDKPLTLSQLSQMLWAAQGVTDKTGKRTTPSSREVYPYTIYVVAKNVGALSPGLYEYLPKENALGDMGLANAGQIFNNAGVEETAKGSPVVFILAAAFDKGLQQMPKGTTASVYLEGGHIGQNLYLEAQSLKLGMVVQGGIGKAHSELKLDPAETIVYVVPIGYPAPPSTPSSSPVSR